MINIVTADLKRYRNGFIKLPWIIYQHHPHWIPPLLSGERYLFNKKKNIFFQDSDAEFFLALKDGRAVGRLVAIKYAKHLEIYNDQTGFFGFFESLNDLEIANGLFDAAFNWARKQGLKRMIGPYNFTFDDGGGLLIKGFDRSATYQMNYNHSYYEKLVLQQGFSKMLDLYTYEIDIPNCRLDRIQSIAERAENRNHVTVKAVDFSRFEQEVKAAFDIYKNAFEGSIGYVNFSAEKFNEMALTYKRFCDPDLLFIARKNDEPIGIGIVIPDMNPLIKKWNGRLFPKGWLDLLLGVHKKLKTARFVVIATTREHRFLGTDAALFYTAMKTCQRKGYTWGEASWIQEGNHKIKKTLEKVGFVKDTTYRLYEKFL